MSRHPRKAALRDGDEDALLHAETCERCADLLLEDDEAMGGELRSMLTGLLDPSIGFGERTTAATVERIRMQDVWDLVGDTAGGVMDALRILGDRQEGER